MSSIHYYKNETTGELAPPHRIGTDEEGRDLYQFVEGWIPVDKDGNLIAELESDQDGNWYVGDTAE